MSKRLGGFPWAIAFFLFALLSSCIGQAQKTIDVRENKNAILVQDYDWPGADTIIWSPVSDHILVNSVSRNDNYSLIYLIDLEKNTSATIFQTSPGDGVVQADDWSPDGKEIILNVIGGGTLYEKGLWIAPIGGLASMTYLTPGQDSSWSSNGNVAFRDDDLATPNRALLLYYIDGKYVDGIYDPENRQIAFPSWAPDNSEIVFSMCDVEAEDPKEDLFVLEIETGNIRQITTSGNNTMQDWSPLGGLIAYIHIDTSESIPIFNLSISDPNGDCTFTIRGLKDPWSPTWSPDSRRIAFISEQNVYVIDLSKIFGNNFPESGIPCE